MFELPGVKPGSDIEVLFKAIGFVVVQWGHAEQNLDLLVATIFSRFEDHKLIKNKNRPQNLSPKIEFLNNCFHHITELSEFKKDSDDLLNRFSVIGKKRNDIVHGAITSTFAESSSFVLLKIDVKAKESHCVRPIFLNDYEWYEFRKDLMLLGKDSVSLAQRVWSALKLGL